MTRIPLAAALLALCACTSPEQGRAPGEAGADVGNRGTPVVMHEGSQPYANTPRLLPTQAPTVEPASQARQPGMAR